MTQYIEGWDYEEAQLLDGGAPDDYDLQGDTPTVASIMIGGKKVQRLPHRITTDGRQKIKALCSYIGYDTRGKNDNQLPQVEISNENLNVMYRALGFDFTAKYTILGDFLSRNDNRVSSWDNYFATIPTSRTRTEETEGLKLQKKYFGTENLVHKTTEQINPLYRNTLVWFGLIKEKVEKNVGFLCSISYPGGNTIQRARLSLFLRLNEEQRIVFCKRQLGMPYTDGYASCSTLSEMPYTDGYASCSTLSGASTPALSESPSPTVEGDINVTVLEQGKAVTDATEPLSYAENLARLNFNNLTTIKEDKNESTLKDFIVFLYEKLGDNPYFIIDDTHGRTFEDFRDVYHSPSVKKLFLGERHENLDKIIEYIPLTTELAKDGSPVAKFQMKILSVNGNLCTIVLKERVSPCKRYRADVLSVVSYEDTEPPDGIIDDSLTVQSIAEGPPPKKMKITMTPSRSGNGPLTESPFSPITSGNALDVDSVELEKITKASSIPLENAELERFRRVLLWEIGLNILLGVIISIKMQMEEYSEEERFVMQLFSSCCWACSIAFFSAFRMNDIKRAKMITGWTIACSDIFIIAARSYLMVKKNKIFIYIDARSIKCLSIILFTRFAIKTIWRTTDVSKYIRCFCNYFDMLFIIVACTFRDVPSIYIIIFAVTNALGDIFGAKIIERQRQKN
jgi:hypothetical protein